MGRLYEDNNGQFAGYLDRRRRRMAYLRTLSVDLLETWVGDTNVPMNLKTENYLLRTFTSLG